jgi:hypothetical protein
VQCRAARTSDQGLVGGGQMWLDVVGIIIVCTFVFVLVAVCERERH